MDAEAWVGADGVDDDEGDSEPLDWQDEAAAKAEKGEPVLGLPCGMRVRVPNKRKLAQEGDDDNPAMSVAMQMASPPSKYEVYGILVLFVGSLITTAFFLVRHVLPFGNLLGLSQGLAAQAPASCRQCQHEWWDDFWDWRFEGIDAATQGAGGAHSHQPPPGMHWEWEAAANHTDWLGVSEELVETVVSQYAEPGPLLQIGCGDSPLPELLHRAGFREAEHLDVVPHVINAMQERYPAEKWPGMQFRQRDFLATREGGAPGPHHRFVTVIDKMGIWDWLQDEASDRLPLLLDAVRDALVKAPGQGVYIIVTKQTPVDFSHAIAHATDGRAPFLVEATRPLGKIGLAWSYVLTLA